jgi:hypothetical protein
MNPTAEQTTTMNPTAETSTDIPGQSITPGDPQPVDQPYVVLKTYVNGSEKSSTTLKIVNNEIVKQV